MNKNVKHGYEVIYEHREEISKLSGKLMLWIIEGRNTAYMAEQLNLSVGQVETDIDEMIYTLRKRVGNKRFIKNLLLK